MSKVSTKISFPVTSFRKIVSPHELDGASTYMAVVAVKDMPEQVEEWRSINVRDPRLKSGVAREIRASLINSPEMFFFKNRGMTIMADKVTFDNDSNTVALELHDPRIHGLLDGG